MKHGVYCVRDTCVAAFLVPMYFVNRAAATRAFGDAVNNPAKDNQFYQHPEHYQLYECGSFDDENGLFSLLPAPEFVVDAVSLVRSA